MKKTFTILIAAIAAIMMMTLPEKVVGQTKTTTTIASWGKVSIAANTAIYASGGDSNNNGTAQYISTKAMTSAGNYCYYGSAAGGAVITFSNLDLSGYEDITMTFYTRASQQGTMQISWSSNGTDYTNLNAPNITKSEAQKTSDEIPNTATHIKLAHTKTTGSLYFGTIEIKGTASSGGGSTPSINANNVNIAFNETSGSITYEIQNGVSGGAVTSATITASSPLNWLTVNGSNQYSSPISLTCAANSNYYARTATVRLTYTYNTNQTVTKDVTVTQASNPTGPGSSGNPYTVAEARAAIDAVGTIENAYATGKVSEITTAYNSTYSTISYNISADGLTTSDQLKIYRGVCTDADEIQVGDVVVIKGKLTKYNSTYEFDEGGTLQNLVLVAPTFYPEAGAVASGSSLTISDAHTNATIYYTTDGTAPNTSSNLYNSNNKPTITAATTFKAIAIKSSYSSEIVSASYTVLTPVETPVITLDGGTYYYAQITTITCGTEGATIYYTTNGSNPTTSSTAYEGAISINESMTIKAIAAKSDMANSAVAEASYIISIPAINASDVNIPYNETSGTITSTITNAVEGGALTAVITSGNEGTWLSLGTVNGTNVPLICSANEGNENRTATVTLTYTYSGNHTVITDVTVTQAKYVKDYADLPFSFDGGRGDIANTTGLTQDGLDTDYNSSPKLKFNSAGDCVILKINETPGKLTFDIKGNSLGGTYKFSVMESANGADYFALKEYTSISSSTSSETLTPTSTTRYIKWVYTTKGNGNVALGNINLKAPEPTITVSPESVGVLASGVIDATLSLTYERLEISEAGDFTILFCDENGDEPTPAPDWITAEVDGTSDDYVVSYTVEENDDEERTAYFKVFALRNEDYVYSNLVTVTQAAYVAPQNKYIRFSGELVEGDYLIVYNGGAMNNTVTNDRLQYEEVTAINNVIATDDNTIIWHIAKSGNYWTIKNKNDNKYAASNGKNKAQMLDDGTADEALWTITGTTTYDFENKARAAGTDSGNKWLRKNGTYGFACYASGTGGALSLYIKNCVLPVTNDELTESTEIPEGNITVYDDLTIPSGEDFVLTVSGTLEVQGTLTNTVASHLIVKEGGQLIIPAAKADPVKATFQREIEGYTNAEGKDNYYLIANPTTTELDPEDDVEYMLSNEYDLFYFDESQEGEEWRNYKQDAFNLENRKGYLYANNKAVTLKFAGTVPTGTSANITLSKTDDNTYAGFNLVGNPMSVNITSMVINSTECSYYKLDPSYGTFGVSTDPIIVGEAFMVEALSDGATLSLNPGLKGESDFNNDVIRLEVSNNKYTDVAYLYFGNHLPLTKINHLNDEAPMLYIHTESANQAVAVMNERSEVKTVNVNFEAKTMGMYTISAKADKDNFSYMHLYDRLTGADTDLLISDYTFIGSTTDATGRFILRFEAIDNNSESESFAYQNGSDIIINGEGELQIFDVMGRMISTQNVNGRETVNVSAQGVYIFRLNGMTQKIVVR